MNEGFQQSVGFEPFQENRKLKILGLLLQETGTYNPMFIRPYVTHVTKDAIDTISNRIDQTGDISASTFSGLSGSMISPASSNMGMIPIPNGWQEKRVSFVLTLESVSNISGNKIVYVQGYTDYAGVTASGAIDPRMRFFINSMTTVARNVVQTPMGAQYSDRVIETAQVINGKLFTEYMGYGGFTDPNQGIYGLRPYDVFMSAQTSKLINGFDNLNDTRVRLDGNTNSSKSMRKNNLPTNYLSTLVKNYSNSSDLMDFGAMGSDVYSRAASLSHDGGVNNNEFVRAIEMYSGIPNSTEFNINILETIDPGVGTVTNFYRVGNPQLVGLHSAGQTEHWHGANRETIAATLLSNAVPALMLEYMINKINFRTTNHDLTGMMTTTIIDAKSLTNLDLTKGFQMFKHRLETELLYDLTFGNQIPYLLDMECHVFGESRISISLDSGPMIQYTTPSFCDSLITPIYSTNKNNLYTLSHDIEQIFSYLDNNPNKQNTQMPAYSLI